MDNITNLLNYGVSEMALLTFINMLYNLAKASEVEFIHYKAYSLNTYEEAANDFYWIYARNC